MKTIIFSMDSLNRHFLPVYGNTWVRTPNIDRLASRSCVFDNHYVGSAPCMPARHDLLTGRLDFLERGWGAIQPFDCTLPYILNKHGIFSHMETDHYHYFHIGGENYHCQFGSWNLVRGQEKDVWASDFNTMEEREHYGQDLSQYRLNRERFHSEEEYPSPQTLRNAADWIEEHRENKDWLLYVDAFDPHEPFDFPDANADEYPDSYEDKLFYWPDYATSDQATEEALAHMKRLYAELITMNDRWLGRALDVLDKYNLWDDTMVILTTDHGFMFGEHGYVAKNYMPSYNEIFHIPLMISLPGMTEMTRSQALTQNIDIMPTILEFYGISEEECRFPLHGRSLLPVISGKKEKVRDAVIYGTFGRQVNICDGRYTYFRAPVREDNQPLNIYTAMPTTIWQYWDYDHISDFSKIEMGPYLPYTAYPVYKIPSTITKVDNGSQDFKCKYKETGDNMLFDLENDPGQEHPLDDPALEQEMCRKLAQAMRMHDCPEEQFTRLGL